MNPFLKWSGIVLGGIAAFATMALVSIYAGSELELRKTYPRPSSRFRATSDAAAAARGAHLAQIAGCADCHGDRLQGVFLDFVPQSRVYSKNLPVLARSFSEADFDRAIRHGMKPDGTSLAAMPSNAYAGLSDDDVSSLIAYIRALTPQGAQWPDSSFGLLVRAGLLMGKFKTAVGYFADNKPSLDLGPRFAQGRHLAGLACAECHQTDLKGSPNDPIAQAPDLSLVAAYDRGDFLRFLRTGKAAGNRELPIMSATARKRFSHFTDAEVNAIYDYLSERGRKLTQ